MLVTVISHTIQEYAGRRYYRCGRYFQHKGERLHRRVWEYQNGPVPDGHHVHHRDHDTSHNEQGNLELLPNSSHLSYHAKKSGHGRTTIAVAAQAAKEWHGSEAGRDWHREHYAERVAPVMARRAEATCLECGAVFETSAVHVHMARYCSGRCRQRANRARRKNNDGTQVEV